MSFQEYSNSLKSKLNLGNVNTKLVIGVLVFVIFALSFSAYALFTTDAAYSNDTEIKVSENASSTLEEANSASSSAASEASSTSEIYVHVAGRVKNPGLYKLGANSRIDDAIKAAGGFSKLADKEAVNLAEVISDGQQIIIPKKESKQNAASVSSNTGVPASSNNTNASATGGSDGLVNINTATLEELQTLSGIGEAKAKKIIDYREQSGPFSSVDDLTNVSGIGEKTLESIRGAICV